ncbi:hypothetical protein NL676_033162 [Syzygium grande]|nr:hypothetical protein NL676_033162 [Syzygium grande]
MKDGINYVLQHMVAEEEQEAFMRQVLQYCKRASNLFTCAAKTMPKASHPFHIHGTISEAFTVEDSRGEFAKKRFPLLLSDYVWRLTEKYHWWWNLRCYVETYFGACHVMCLDAKQYVYYCNEGRCNAILFNWNYELKGLICNGQFLDRESLSSDQSSFCLMTSHFPDQGDMLLPWNEQHLENVLIGTTENWKPRKAAVEWLKLKAAFRWAITIRKDGCNKTGQGAGMLRPNNTFDVTTLRVYMPWEFVTALGGSHV